jgi:hypothetical protein
VEGGVSHDGSEKDHMTETQWTAWSRWCGGVQREFPWAEVVL